MCKSRPSLLPTKTHVVTLSRPPDSLDRLQFAFNSPARLQFNAISIETACCGAMRFSFSPFGVTSASVRLSRVSSVSDGSTRDRELRGSGTRQNEIRLATRTQREREHKEKSSAATTTRVKCMPIAQLAEYARCNYRRSVAIPTRCSYRTGFDVIARGLLTGKP